MKRLIGEMGVWSFISLLIIDLGILIWLLFFTIPFLQVSVDQGWPIWLLTFIIHPIGVILGIIAVKKNNRFCWLAVIGNAIMTLSLFPILWFATILFGP